jgi:hypothetical protein
LRADFNSFRTETLAAVKNSNLKIFPEHYDWPTPTGTQCTTDYIVRQCDSQDLIVVLSGTHGVEGYFGSLVLRKIFSELGNHSLNGYPNLLFVHALNCFGMSWYRRTNFNNVDLNRNGCGKVFDKNEEFDLIKPYFDQNNSFARKLFFLKSIPRITRTWGPAKTLEVACQGQSHYPESLFYTGTEFQPEIVNLMKKIKNSFSGIKRIWIVDYHTGLGRFMQESLIPEDAKKVNPEIMKSIYERNLITSENNRFYYSVNGSISEAFTGHFPECAVRYVCAEYGTQNSFKVIEALAAENIFYRNFDYKLDAKISNEMLDCFFPDSESWRQVCVQYGFQAFIKMVHFVKNQQSR